MIVYISSPEQLSFWTVVYNYLFLWCSWINFLIFIRKPTGISLRASIYSYDNCSSFSKSFIPYLLVIEVVYCSILSCSSNFDNLLFYYVGCEFLFPFAPSKNLLTCSLVFCTVNLALFILLELLHDVSVLFFCVAFNEFDSLSFCWFFIVFRIAIYAFSDSNLSCWVTHQLLFKLFALLGFAMLVHCY